MADTSQVKEITQRLEQGVKDLFTSDRYADYLKTMSRFHKYSTRNTLLIHMQKPDATLVAGFRSWQTKFGRSVNKGEKAIKILAPVPFTKREEKEKIDPETRQPIIGDDGMPVIEFAERQLARFKVTSVFDLSQTSGKPLPSLVQDLVGDVEQYKAFMDALSAVSPLPIVFEAMSDNQDGVCRFGKEIAIRSGMSEVQTVCAVIHEMTHAKLHDQLLVVGADGSAEPKDRRTEELEAESVSYSVCQYFGIETGDNSFGYLAEWSKNRDLKELNASLDTIRKTAAKMITDIEGKLYEIIQDRDITLAVGETQVELAVPMAVKQSSASDARLDNKLFDKISELFPQVISGEYSYLRLEAGDGFMPLSIEGIGDNQISVMHTYTLNGDLCYDPMVIFELDNESKTLTAVAFEQSLPPLYQVKESDGQWLSIDGNGNQKSVSGLEDSINEFAAQWFNNISDQGYMPVRANMEIGGDCTQITFDADGKPVIPEPEKWQEQEEPQRELTGQVTVISDSGDADSDPPEPELMMPDPYIGYSDMNQYGYTGDEMLPLSQSRATELFDADHTIYLLYPDNTEAMVFDRDEIVYHYGIFGIERTDWEASLEHAAMKAETKTREGSREAELLYGSGNRFGIYQVKDGTDQHDFRFASLEEVQARGLDISRNNYELVYTEPFEDRVEFLTDRYSVLNKIYEQFNIDHPDDYTGRSVSVSDVIVLKCNKDFSAHYVDSIGFVEIEGFLGEERLQLPENPAHTVEINKTEPYSKYRKRARNEQKKPFRRKPSLKDRLAENKLIAARQNQPDTINKTIKQGARE